MTLRLNLQAVRALLVAIFTLGVMLFLQSCDDASNVSGSPEVQLPAKKEVPISFAPVAGVYLQAQRVSVACSTSCKQIRYTVNGKAPTLTSTLYEGPILVSTSLKLSVSAFDSTGVLIGSSSASYTINGLPWNIDIAYDSFVDARDGQAYRSVRIGGQVWMAQNLNYAGQKSDTGICFQNGPSYCLKYGRLYTWDEAMKGATTSESAPSGIQGLCPAGWHAPSDTEFRTLISFVESDPRVGAGKAAIALKASTSAWAENVHPTAGTNLFGFTALPAGYFDAPYNFLVGGFEADWWVTWINDTRSTAKYFALHTDKTFLSSFGDRPVNSRSLRCVKD